MNRGQVTVLVPIIGAAGTILAAIFGSYATASNRVYQVESQVKVVEEREENHYQEVQKRLNSIDAKLDKLLDQKASLTKTQ